MKFPDRPWEEGAGKTEHSGKLCKGSSAFRIGPEAGGESSVCIWKLSGIFPAKARA